MISGILKVGYVVGGIATIEFLFLKSKTWPPQPWYVRTISYSPPHHSSASQNPDAMNRHLAWYLSIKLNRQGGNTYFSSPSTLIGFSLGPSSALLCAQPRHLAAPWLANFFFQKWMAKSGERFRYTPSLAIKSWSNTTTTIFLVISGLIHSSTVSH